jgi:hypothetical protein
MESKDEVAGPVVDAQNQIVGRVVIDRIIDNLLAVKEYMDSVSLDKKEMHTAMVLYIRADERMEMIKSDFREFKRLLGIVNLFI